MLNINSIKVAALVAGLTLSCALNVSAQKKVLDHDVYDSWQSVSGTTMTRDGKFLSFMINPQEGDNQLIIRNLTTGEEVTIERGSGVTLSQDGKWAVCTVKPTFAQSRAAKNKKGAKPGDDNSPKDSLAYVDLSTMKVVKVAGVSSVRTAKDNIGAIVYKSTDKKGSKLVILDPATGKADTLKNIDKFNLNKAGDRLAVVTKKDKADSLSKDGVAIYKLPSLEVMDFSETLASKKSFTVPTFDETGTMAWMMATSDTVKSGSKMQAIYLFKEVAATKKVPASWSLSEILPQGYSDGVPAGYGVTDAASARFTLKGGRLLVNLPQIKAPKDTTIIESEQAKLDIWNYDALRLPPQQKVSRGARTIQGEIDLANPGKMIILTKTPEERLTLIKGGETDLGIISDDSKYAIDATWNGKSYSDVYFVNLKDGSRRLLAQKQSFGYGLSQSPTGKYLIYFNSEKRQWFTYNIESDTYCDITSAIGVNFYNEETDTPSDPSSYGSAIWLENDEAVIVPDRYDLWKITPDGKKAECLTKGIGRQKKVQFRYSNIVDDPDLSLLRQNSITVGLAKKAKIYLSAFDEDKKLNGFGTMSIAAPQEPQFFLDTFTFSGAVKAKNAEVIAFLKGNVRKSNNQYITRDFFKTDIQLSDINQQQKDYVWPNVQLVEWKAYDGTPLKGLLYTPDNLDKSKKYPMMIYFYEKYSETLYSYKAPSPSRSTVNIPLFASRGYVVFVPDIVYVDGHPGECAYNCICSGAEAMCDQFSFIDKSKMAIQGQSWGGYQTAYLVTRTNMFAAAGAGAPVGNMTSAYGGIRWESGNSRAVQYEHGQSRIGKSLWDEGGLELYIENSPVFHVQNVTTPVLIMHNDADGAVPWYQGIEYFMALRHFGHPAWLLEYNDEAHNLGQRKNAKDLSRRLTQFFDHYLKGEPMPAWMKTGVPTDRKGEYYGFEYAE